MKIPKWILGVALWLLLGLPGTGWTFAYWNRKYSMAGSCRETAAQAYMMAAFGPVSSVMTFFLTGFAEDGVKFTCGKGDK